MTAPILLNTNADCHRHRASEGNLTLLNMFMLFIVFSFYLCGTKGKKNPNPTELVTGFTDVVTYSFIYQQQSLRLSVCPRLLLT